MLTRLERDAAVKDGLIGPGFVPDNRIAVGKSLLVARVKEALEKHGPEMKGRDRRPSPS